MVAHNRWITLASFTGTAVGGFMLLKFYSGSPPLKLHNEEKWRPLKSPTDERVTVLVTGATGTIGKTACWHLAKRGANLLMGCRDSFKCADLRNKIRDKHPFVEVECLEVDFGSFDSIHRFANKLSRRKVDAWINCVGVMGFPQRKVSSDGIEMQLAVNCLSPFLLSQLMRESGRRSNARFIFLSRNPQHLAQSDESINMMNLNWDDEYNGLRAYRQSQIALISTITKLAREENEKRNSDGSKAKEDGLRVYIVNPGEVYSKYYNNMPYNTLFLSRWIFSVFNLFLMRPAVQGAITPLYCALVDPPPSAVFFKDLKPLPEESSIIQKLDSIVPSQLMFATAQKWTAEQ